MARQYWLYKSEPDVFSYDDLEKAPDRTTSWEGVRNYQARNYLRDAKVGDGVFFYHSNASPTAIVGTAKVVRTAYPDPTQFDPKSNYYDAGAKPEEPRWMMVDVQADERLPRPMTLDDLRGVEELSEMVLLRKGSRLSVQPVTPAEWKAVLKLSKRKRS